ncbi:MAG: RNA methyltransferase [Myxococcota bacterium]
MRRYDPDAFQPDLHAVLPAPSARVIKVLGAVVTEARLARIRGVIAQRTRRVVPVLEGLSDPHNGSAILRSADAFGISDVHIVPGEHGFFAARTVSKGAHRWLDLHGHASSEACADALEALGYPIYVASMEGALRPADLASLDRCAIVFGNERHGPSETLRRRATGTYAVPMRGFVESLNVSVAAAITLHGVVADRPGDRDEADQEALLARMLFRSIPRAAEILAEAE